MKLVTGIIISAVLMLALFLGPEAEAGYYVVDDDGGSWADYTTIQDAINDSSVGRHIYVYEGVYEENVVVNQTVTLIGNHSSNTTIDAQGSGHTVVVDADHVNMTGFTITGSGTATGNAGVNLASAASFHMGNCTVDTTGGWNLYQVGDHNAFYDNCTFLNSTNGAFVAYSNDITFEHCIFELHEKDGILWYGSQYGAVQNSTFVDCGIRVWGQAAAYFNHNTVLNSTTNGDPIRYYVGVSDLVVPDNTGQVFVVSCDGAVVECLDLANSSTGITVAFSDDVLVANSTLDDMYYSLQATTCDNLTVRNVTVTGEPRYGFDLESVTNSLVDDCNLTMPNGTTGVFLDSGCHHVTLNGTYITASSENVKVTGANITVQNCTLFKSSWSVYITQDSSVVSGCDIEGAFRGITMANSGWHTVVNTSIHGGSTGIQGQTTDNCTVAYNEIFGNTGYGVHFTGSEMNSIHHNNFKDNNEATSQGYDDAGNNKWDDGVDEGNYWEDWSGSGNYSIDGSADAADEYPLSDPADTNAPEKIPEFGILTSLIAITLLLLVVFRR